MRSPTVALSLRRFGARGAVVSARLPASGAPQTASAMLAETRAGCYLFFDCRRLPDEDLSVREVRIRWVLRQCCLPGRCR